MEGSGLKELFCEIYAENFVDKILKGHSYARAVRGHIITHLAIEQVLLAPFESNESETNFL